MRRVLQITITVLLFAATASIGVLTWYGAHMLAAWTDTAHQMNATLEVVNRPCGKVAPCGTLADVNRTLATVRGTFGQVETAARHENAQLTTLDGQERALFADLHGAIGDARETITGARDLTQVASGTLQTTQETLRTSQTALASLNQSFVAGTTLVESLRRRADDPRVDSLISHADQTAQHVDGATADVQGAIHRVTNPPPCKGRMCWLIDTGRALWMFHDVPEPVYYIHELLR